MTVQNKPLSLFIALVSGVVLTLAHTPFNIAILAAPALTVLILISNDKSIRAGFAIGLAFGIGHYTTLYSWIYSTAIHVPNLLFELIALATATALLGAFFIGLVVAVLRTLKLTGIANIIAFAGLLVLAEWIRSWFLSGFPWALLGYVADVHPVFAQPASLGGIWLLTFLVAICASSPALYWDGHKRVAFIIPVLIVSATSVFGHWRLSTHPTQFHPTKIALVQPNIPQAKKWDIAYQDRALSQLIAVSSNLQADLVIWPETAIIAPINKRPRLQKHLARAVPKSGYLITGAPRVVDGSKSPANSLYALNEFGEIKGLYDKHHLVPIGEYPLFKGAPDITIHDEEPHYAPGPGPQTIKLKNIPPLSPTICYEMIFPGNVIDRNSKPEWILNIGNDGWSVFDNGPTQHFMHSRFRAIEEGLPVVRLSNNGPSGIIDPYGRVLSELMLNHAGTHTGALPHATSPTLFSQMGNWSVLVILILALMSVAALNYSHRKENT